MSRARTTHLKIKIHTLADEARHIRREERKARQREFYASPDKMIRKADSLERFARWADNSENSSATRAEISSALAEAEKLRARAQNFGDERKAHAARRERLDLRDHRKGVVRTMSRSCLLAYGYLRGVPYAKIEQNHREDNYPNWREAEKIIKRFGGDPSGFRPWLKGETEVSCAAK